MPLGIEGKYTFAAAPDVVWEALQDPAVLARCIPGCQKLDPVGEDRYQATMTVGVAGIRGTFSGEVHIQEKDPPNGYRLVVGGSGGPGFVKGSGVIRLVPEAQGTLVTVTGEAEVGGTLAAVGQRMLMPVARMLMNQFFGCLQQQLAQRAASPETASDGSPSG